MLTSHCLGGVQAATRNLSRSPDRIAVGAKRRSIRNLSPDCLLIPVDKRVPSLGLLAPIRVHRCVMRDPVRHVH